MRKLQTIQTKEKLNNVYAIDKVGPGGANHNYIVINKELDEECGYCEQYAEIKLQCGARKEEGSQHGVIDTDLLEIVRDRLKAFQAGPFKSEYNEEALQGVEMALNALNKRIEDRIARNVLGKSKK